MVAPSTEDYSSTVNLLSSNFNTIFLLEGSLGKKLLHGDHLRNENSSFHLFNRVAISWCPEFQEGHSFLILGRDLSVPNRSKSDPRKIVLIRGTQDAIRHLGGR